MDIRAAHNQFTREFSDGTIKTNSPGTIKNYQNSLHLLLLATPVTKVEDMTETLLRQFARFGEMERKWSPNTQLTHRKNLQPFTLWCVKKGLLAKDPFAEIERPPLPELLPSYYSDEEMERILYVTSEEAKNDFLRKRNLAMLAVLRLAGLRKSEFLGLRVWDLDFESNYLKVRASNAKDRGDRVIPMSSKLVQRLQSYIDIRKEKKSDLLSLWLSDHGKSFSHHGWDHFVKHLSGRLKFNVKTHKFRHTFATKYYQATHDVIGLKQLLGHKDLNTTMIYAQVAPDDLRKSLEISAINSLF
jgi:integrase/recombinase XerD